MKSFHFFCAVCIFVAISTMVRAGTYSGGDGSEANPYQIATPEDWVELTSSSSEDIYYILIDDIDLSGLLDLMPVGSFHGYLEGDGHVVSNAVINLPDRDFVGLFGKLSFAEIKNLGIENINVIGRKKVGGLVGGGSNSNIYNCYLNGSVSGNESVGGLVGCPNECEIFSCYSAGVVSGEINVGGLAGYSSGYNEIGNCYSACSVFHGDGFGWAGGMFGYLGNGSVVSNSYATGQVSSLSWAGGLVGLLEDSDILNCYSTGSVTGDGNVGGLVGVISYGTVRNCYSTGLVSGNGDIGGLVGSSNVPYRLFASFWDVESSGIFDNDYYNEPRGLNTTQMQSLVTFTDAGWSFINDSSVFDWYMPEDGGCPRLAWELMSAEVKYSGGSGTEYSPCRISTPEDWVELTNSPNDWSLHFVLTEDIDLSYVTDLMPVSPDTNSDERSFQGVSFSGSLDGNGHIISNATINLPDCDYVGLFGSIEDAEIKDLGIENISVAGLNYVGGLGGYIYHVNIANCYSNGYVSGNRSVGSLAGFSHFCMIDSSHSSGEVSGGVNVGGLVGQCDSEVMNCSSTCSVFAVNDAHSVGGLLGVSTNSSLTKNCYATGSVSGIAWVGGLIGFLEDSDILDCYSTGDVAGIEDVGGLVGYTAYGNIDNCYSAGLVSGNDEVGGFVGTAYYCNFGRDFWDVESSGALVGVGYDNESNYYNSAIGLSVAQMQDISIFINAGWDFVDEVANGQEDVWVMDGYPVFPWAMTVDMRDIAILAQYWQVTGCSDGDSCSQADWNSDGSVDYSDLLILSENWLEKEIDIFIAD